MLTEAASHGYQPAVDYAEKLYNEHVSTGKQVKIGFVMLLWELHQKKVSKMIIKKFSLHLLSFLEILQT